jgi:hypothetical protein
MGQQAAGLAFMLGGKVIGSYFGGPIGGAVGALAGGLIASFIFNRSSKPLVPDTQLTSSSYGHFIPIIYGQCRLPATVIWETDIETQSHNGISSFLGKGSSATSYKQNAAFAFCQGPARLLKVWLDGKLWLDVTSATPVTPQSYYFPIRGYNGDEFQLPDPLIAQWVSLYVSSPTSCPAYRGLAYLVFQDVDLSHYGNRMPNVTAAWTTSWEDKVITRQLMRFAGDVSPSGVWIQGVATDWLSNRVYQMKSDGRLRVFDINNGSAVASVTMEQMLEAIPEVDQPFRIGALASIAVTPGSQYVYIGGMDAGYNPTLLAVDTGSMRVAYSRPLWNSTSIWDNDFPAHMVPFQIQSADTGLQDMLLIGTYNWEGWYIVNPDTGVNSGILPTHYNGGYPGGYSSDAIVGKQDVTAGTVDLWIVQNTPGIFGPDDPADDFLYIHKVTVDSDNPSTIAALGMCQEVGRIAPTDLGLTPGIPGFHFWSSVNVVYDPSDDSLIITAPVTSVAGSTLKWKEDVGVVWLQPDQVAVSWGTLTTYYQLDAGLTGAANGGGNDYWVTQSIDGQQSPLYHTSGPSVSPDGVWAYSSALNAMVIDEYGRDEMWVIYLQRAAAGEVPVGDILRDLCLRAGLTDADIDVTQVTASCVGYAITEEKSYGAAIMDLCHSYQIDMTESDYKLKFVQRGAGPIATITQADLTSSNNSDPGNFWETKRAIEQELPMQINLRYADVDLDYQPGASYSKRIANPVATTFSRRVKSVDLPVVAHNAEARHIAEVWLYTMWAERDTYRTKTAQKYLWLDPTDNVTVAFDSGDQITTRIQTTELGDDFSMALDLCAEDIETFVTSNSPPALISYQPQVIKQSGFIDLLQFNTPLLQDSDDTGGGEMRIYYAGGPNAAVSSSTVAVLYQSLDGTSWPAFAQTSAFADWGRATNVLGDTVAAFATDYVNSLTYFPTAGSATPASCTYLEMMNGANPALVGREIIQYQLAARNADGSYTLSTLLRGRRGTEWACGGHVLGELVVLLEMGKIQVGRLPLSQRGQTSLWKLVPTGRFIDSTPADSFAYRAFDLMPYAPVNAKRQVSGANLLLTWVRRTRLGGLQVDGTDTAPLGEEHEEYEVYLLDSPSDLAHFDPANPTTYRRAFLALTTSSLTYTAAQMASDGFDMAADPLCAVIYQISAVVGRGFPGFHELEPPGGGLSVGLEDDIGSWATVGGAWLWG